ncbi:MAG: IS1634 family transposase [Clostridia bacterium]|jgi:transposase|nr:IS1634 family transposase [Clostridia bacterium]
MTITDQDNSQLLASLKDVNVYSHGHLPMAAAYCRHLQIAQTIDTLAASEMQLSPGQAVTAMVLDVLSGRSPLYHVKDFLAGQDIELLLGEDLDPERFSDYTLARSLDAIAACGTGRIVTELGIKAVQQFQLDTSAVSFDTTSTSVWGEYERDEQEAGPNVTLGHSKDQQPQLKQFMTELLCVDRGVPIFSRVVDGNASDKNLNNEMLQRIGKLMKAHGLGPGAFVYVADSAMVTQDNLALLGDNRFISRLPATFSACDLAIQEAIARDAWSEPQILQEISSSPSRPPAQYKAYETTVEIDGSIYRAVVIHSSAHDKRRQKKVERQLASSRTALEKVIKKLRTEYFCEADARSAVEDARKNNKGGLHVIRGDIQEYETRRPGRPPKNQSAPTATRYRVTWTIDENKSAIEELIKQAGCFVLITNMPQTGPDALDSLGVLRTYKGQYGVENDFAFLKDPLIVNDLFLKTPARIDALGVVLVIALLVARLMEVHMRRYLEIHGKTVSGLNNVKTKKPTFYAMTCTVMHIQVLVLNHLRLLKTPPNDRQAQFLIALGLDDSVFTDSSSTPTIIAPKVHS